MRPLLKQQQPLLGIDRSSELQNILPGKEKTEKKKKKKRTAIQERKIEPESGRRSRTEDRRNSDEIESRENEEAGGIPSRHSLSSSGVIFYIIFPG